MFSLVTLLLLLAVAVPARAAQGQGTGAAATPSYSGPAPPAPPALIARDEQGRMTIRAVRLASPLRIDGKIDEAAYDGLDPISDFIQMEPAGGQPATERTDVWLFFDEDNFYVSMRAWESEPDRMVVNEMRRDSFNLLQGDHVGFSLDTFYDRRNAFQFVVNPLGARLDGQSTNERQYSGDWNPVWDLAVGRFAGGWTVEAAIPFKSLRYRPGREQVWGFNARRQNKSKNEISYITRIPPAFGVQRGSFAASLFATVVGIDAPPGSKNLEVKPYATGDLRSDRVATPRVANDGGGDFGVDAKYGITQSLTADLTYNTDFAQVEADEQQINLTRFNVLFPEKREFFLENSGTFGFAGVGGGQSFGGGGADTPILFYSRRIGLNLGRQIPIWAGGRLTGRAGRFSLGLINIQTKDEPKDQVPANQVPAPSTNFSVVRVKRDILRRSSVGGILTTRSVAQNPIGSNQAFGVDGAFAFFSNVFVNTYWAKTRTEGVKGDDASYRAQFDYAGDRYGLQLERLRVGDNFNPEVGFVRRDNMRKTFGQFRFSPRPKSIKAIRKFSGVGTINYIENSAGTLETRAADGVFSIEFQNSDQFSVGVSDSYELLTRPLSFPVTPPVRVPIGSYDFNAVTASFTFGQQRPVSGRLSVEDGSFYDGHRTTLGWSSSRVNVTPRFSLEPSASINWVDLPDGSFTTKLIGSRVTYTVTPLMFASALVQYNSSSNSVSTNVRLRWEYQPGSELFVVYNEERDSLSPWFPDLRNRAVIVKINRLFRF